MLNLREATSSPERVARGLSDEVAPPIDDSAHYFRPYLDSASWLYLEANPMMRIANPAMHPRVIEYAMPPPKRKAQRHCPSPHNYPLHCQQHNRHHHHHHHHHHDQHQHRHRRNHHRRVASDPGGLGDWNAAARCVARQHRRVLSLGDNNDVVAGLCLVEATIAEASEETPSPDEATRTLTFRKVPWHPNLHMLKTRQS